MRACIQRVSRAQVTVEDSVTGQIGAGLLVYLGVAGDDSEDDVRYLAEKTLGLRIFEDAEGRMNRSVIEAAGGILVISQFTLYGDCRKGRRPSFVAAAPPELAERLYEQFVAELQQQCGQVATGVFRAQMEVESVNDGPVTMLLDSRREF